MTASTAHVQQVHTPYGSIHHFLSTANVERLQSIMYPMKAKAGTRLFWEGDQALKLYYIRSGRVKLRNMTEEGKDFVLSIMDRDDLVGEYGGHGELFHSFSAEVMTDAEIGVIQIKDLDILMYQFGDMAVEFSNWLGMTNRTTQSKFRDLILFGKTGALASTLIRLSNTYGVMGADGIRLNIRLTDTDIAEFIGTARESVNRMLSSLKKDGIIGMENGQIVIKQLEALRKMCCCPTSPACPKEICRI